MIYHVNPPDLADIWPHVEPLIISALRNSPTHDAADVGAAITSGKAVLLIDWSNQVEAIAVTESVTYPKGTWISLWLVATRDDAPLDITAFMTALEHLRESNNFRGFQCVGARHGWFRKIPGCVDEGCNLRLTRN